MQNGFARPNGKHVHPGANLRTEVPEGARRDPHSSWYGYRAEAPTKLVDIFGRPMGRTDDVAFQAPTDPLADRKLSAEPQIIPREIPNLSTQTSWGPNDVRNAIASMVTGIFDQVSQLTDSVLADSRVSSTMASRTGGLLGRPCKFTTAPGYENDDNAKLARDKLEENWCRVFPDCVAGDFLRWVIMQGFGVGSLAWDVSDDVAIPEMSIWHPRYVYYHWTYRCYIALTQDDQRPIIGGDGTWVLQGGYRDWMRGAVWSISQWWLARNYALRDWARYSERHGMPIIKAMTPAASDPAQSGAFKASMSTLGQETVVQLPQGVEEQYSYDLELLEATDQGWQGFHQLIEQCNMEVTLAILGQNLTTEVKEGSFAAARVHADVRQAFLESDARRLEHTLYEQVCRPFAAMNWGNPDLAPVIEWDLTPDEDNETRARTFQAFAQAIMTLRRSGKQVNGIAKLAKDFGLQLDLADVDILQVDPMSGGTGGGGSGGGGFGQ